MNLKNALTILLLLTSINTANANDKQSFENWIEEFKKEAIFKGISANTVNQAFNSVELVERAIKLDKKQPYKTRTFEEYLDLVVPQSRIDRAVNRYNENKELIDKVSKHYGVQPQFIVALWGIESDFGRNMGSFKIIDSLATLSWEGRRAKFFRKELINALKIIDQGHIKYENMKGSWAGAMGQTQFMPSSFVELAVDFDKDSRRDIWGTKADIFASIANYLSKRGWDYQSNWGKEVVIPKNFNKKFISSKVTSEISLLEKLGVKSIDSTKIAPTHITKASIVRPEDDKDKTFIAYPNYKVILKWNRSLYFATAVGKLADEINARISQ